MTKKQPKPGDKPFWLKCEQCNHCWIAAYWPILATRFCKLVKTARCPKCAERQKVIVAKQEDGKLLEAAE